MARRTPETLADYIVVGIAPALIMLLIGSLVFFLIGVFYQGEFPYRLTWVMGLFVLATVCIARISMEEGAGYAALFGLPLGIVVGIAVVSFVQIEGPLAPFSALINLSLLGLIWWCAHQLTWDCTLIDNRQDNTGQGLLQSMGWDVAGADSSVGAQANAPREPATATVTEPAAVPKRPWWQRIFGTKDQPAAHGRWVVYFSVAALPLFGLGQYFIPVDDVAGRRYAFWMLVIYVGSALGLLLTTSFLGLRRYIRQRQLEMPVEMAAAWLSVGVVMILGLLIVSAILPRPAPEYSLADSVQAKLGSFVSPERTASRLGFGPEGAPSDKQQSQNAAENSNAQPIEDGKAAASGRSQGESKSPSQEGTASAQGDDQSEPTADSGSQDGSATGGEESRNGTSGGENKSNQSTVDQKSPPQGKQGDRSEQASESSNGSEPHANTSEQDVGKASEQSGERPDSAQGDSVGQQSAAASPKPAPPLTQLFSNLGNLLRYAFYAVIALIAGFLAWKYRRELAAAWQQLLKELRELFEGWFGRTKVAADDIAAAAPQPVAKTFRDFPDPFATGQAGRMSAPQLVQYSFEALQAWSRDFATPRETGQTPHEFSETLALRQPAIDLPARQLAEIYSRMAYARQTPPAQTTAVLQTLWRTMSDIARRPITAGTGGKPAGSG